jgi:glutamate-5-semialdehyde dehydrogenase
MELAKIFDTIGEKAKLAAKQLTTASEMQKNQALDKISQGIATNQQNILSANESDVANAIANHKDQAFIDRLQLTEARINAMIAGVKVVQNLPDPVGRVLHTTTRPNGLAISRVATPIGVIGMIYESRPNVACDASVLCIKSGNAVILRGGSDSFHSTKIITDIIAEALAQSGLDRHAVQSLPTTNREMVEIMLNSPQYIDVIIPRGGKSLNQLVQQQSKIATLLHLDGVCHTYIHEDADVEKAISIAVNAKMRRTGICGAMENLVIDTGIAADFLPQFITALGDCEVRGEADAIAIDQRIQPITQQDYDQEYLANILAIKLVNNYQQAFDFIAKHSSKHTDAIISENNDVAEKFLATMDCAIAMHNTSSQFADGGEFGMGAEIGIATGKLHARGPVGLEQLNTFKYVVRGDGQVRK